MADPHLLKMNPVRRAFNAVVILSPAEAVPHRFYRGVYHCSCPVRISLIRDNTSQMLIFFILIFHRSLQPVLAVQVHHDAALVKPVMALPEICLYDKAEIPFLCLHLKYRSIVITEMIVGPLPQVSMRFCDNLYHSLINGTAFRFSCPFEFVQIYFHSYPPLFQSALFDAFISFVF